LWRHYAEATRGSGERSLDARLRLVGRLAAISIRTVLPAAGCIRLLSNCRLAALALLGGIAACLLVACAAPRAAHDDALTVRGRLTYNARVALPFDSEATVELVRRRDGRVLAGQRIALAGRQVPVAFELKVQRAAVRGDVPVALKAAIHAQGRPLWLGEPIELRAVEGGELDVGALALRPADAVAIASRLDCGGRNVRVSTVRRDNGDVARLTVDGEHYELVGVVSASGARYQVVGDASTQLWVKGDRATLTLRGEAQPECTVLREAPDALQARGHEPSWQLELGTELRFRAEGLRIEGTAPPTTGAGDARRQAGVVAGRRVDLTLAPRICRDSMTGMPHPYTAEVVIDGRVFRGCGGEPEALLIGAEWIVETIDGAPATGRVAPTLDFGVDGRLAGRATCNAYTTSYVLTGERLAIGATATTMASCPPRPLEQERLFVDILQRARAFDILADGALELEDDRGRRIVARRRAP
jgi:heat shock protein HslJ/uncharacterized lipoprotein YbaY